MNLQPFPILPYGQSNKRYFLWIWPEHGIILPGKGCSYTIRLAHSLRRDSCNFTSKDTWKEPLPYSTGVLALVVFWDLIILMSQSTSWTFKKIRKKEANVRLKFSDLSPSPFSWNRGDYPAVIIWKKATCGPSWSDLDKLRGRASFFLLWKLVEESARSA